jgi:hypothetical protein
VGLPASLAWFLVRVVATACISYERQVLTGMGTPEIAVEFFHDVNAPTAQRRKYEYVACYKALVTSSLAIKYVLYS